MESSIGSILMYATPIIIAAIGGLFSERGGVTNIALEGIMLVGAFVSATINYYLGVAFPNDAAMASLIPWISIFAGALVGVVFSLIHAIASIKYKADQIISGTALNMLALGLTVFVTQVLFSQQRTPTINYGLKRMVMGTPDHKNIFETYISEIYPTVVLALIIVALSAFVMKRTRFGLRLKACGEYPQAAASMGINVYKMRYFGVLLSGFFGGLAGAIMTLTTDTQFSASVIHGFGFIAIATLIFGKWNAWGVLVAGLFFGFSNVLAVSSDSFAIFKGVPKDIFFMLPYILTIVALVITSNKSSGPKAVGEIYDEGKR